MSMSHSTLCRLTQISGHCRPQCWELGGPTRDSTTDPRPTATGGGDRVDLRHLVIGTGYGHEQLCTSV